MGEYASVTYILHSQLPPRELQTKTFKLSVELSEHNEWVKDLEGKTFYAYSSLRYDVIIDGRNLDFPERGNSLDYRFDPIEYSLTKYNDRRKYNLKFNTLLNSHAFINSFTTRFEGFNRVSDQYTKRESTCNTNCQGVNDVFKVIPYKTTPSQGSLIQFSDTSTDDYHGLFKILLSTTNKLNTKVEITFDLTAYLYDGLYFPFFTRKEIVVKDLQLIRQDNRARVECSVLGYEYTDVQFFKQYGNGSRVSVGTYLATSFVNAYDKLYAHEFIWSDENRGMYICKAQYEGITREKIIIV